MSPTPKVIGLRTDSGEVIAQDYQCDLQEDGCWAKRLTVNTAILSVDHAIRGIEEGRMMEVDRSPDPAANCGQGYEGGSHYLFTDGNTIKLEGESDEGQLNQWAAILYVPETIIAADPLDMPRSCLVYASVNFGDITEDTGFADVKVEEGDTPLYVVLSAYSPIVWNFTGHIDRVGNVVVSGYKLGGVVGLDAAKVTFLEGRAA